MKLSLFQSTKKSRDGGEGGGMVVVCSVWGCKECGVSVYISAWFGKHLKFQ